MMLLLILLVPSHVMAEEAARTITLKDIIYKSPTDWEISLNDQKITATSERPPQVVDLQVSADTVRVKWFDKKLDGVVDATLTPFQTYDIESGDAKPARIAPPQGMTGNEWEWVQNAVTQPYNFTYLNYATQLQKASQYFTKQGWDTYMNVLKNQTAHMSDYGQSLKLTVTSFLRATPLLRSYEVLNGTESWIFDVPLSVRYQSEHSRTDHFNFSITVVRDAQSSSGLSIGEWKRSE